MTDWARSTVECLFGALTPEALASIAAYADQHELGDIGADATFCAVTTSERKQLFCKRSRETSIVVTPALLVWSLSEDGKVTTIGARRSEVKVRDFSSDLVADTGIEVFGFVPIGASGRGSAFIGLGQESAGRRLREALAPDVHST